MILNLEAKKPVDSTKSFGVVSGYPQLRALHSILGLVDDLAFQSLHSLHARWDSGMDKHWNGKVALSKFSGDHRQMPTDSLLAIFVGWPVALYLDSTAISKKMEMMGRLLVTKAHRLIATGVYARRMFFLSRHRLLGYRVQAVEPK